MQNKKSFNIENHVSLESVPQEFSTLVDLLCYRATYQADIKAYIYLKDGETEEGCLTYHKMDKQARAIASQLQDFGLSGERAILLYPPGLEFITAFFGCLYAGVIAVPAYPPRPNRSVSRILAIVDDCQAAAALMTTPILQDMEQRSSENKVFAKIRRIATDAINDDMGRGWQKPELQGGSLAFLQYTSGSTSTPKGVMVSHGNLLKTFEDLDLGWDHTPESVMVTWLPAFHDLGLIYGLLVPLYKGFLCYLMPPVVFIQNPIRWLRAISRYRGTHSAAPNFAFEMCVNKTTPEQRATLDLKSWRNVLNGAEPVRESTMKRFAEVFEQCGFSYSTISPAYGLAEVTLLISKDKLKKSPVICRLQADALMNNRLVEATQDDSAIQSIVGCGWSKIGANIQIVDPETFIKCPSDRVGEIWVSSGSVAHGYWKRPEETEQTFRGYLADTGEGPFLRTGDVGFEKDGELYITGRIKDLVIIRGNNYYPQDIEHTVERCHPALRAGHCAAFSVEIAREERLVVVQEVERTHMRKLNKEDVFGAVRQAIVEDYDLQVYAVVLLRPGSILRTSSGKIQRKACRAAFLEETFKVVAVWRQTFDDQRVPSLDKIDLPQPGEAIQTWLLNRIASLVRITPQYIDSREPFSRYGLDSVSAVNLSGELSKWLGRRLPPTLLYDYPNIEALSDYLAGEKGASRSAIMTCDAQQKEADPIAIIGLGCRFPGAENPDAFWQLLHLGIDAITEVPPSRWDSNAFFDPTTATPGKMNTRWGGFLKDIDQYDPQFFGIAPREAESIDPQQRLLLEVSWEALEHAGIAPDQLSGSNTGVFMGISTDDYTRLQLGNITGANMYAGTGTAFSIAANRLSYVLNLQGPSMAVDTACSSSLVAVHQACQSIIRGECDLALAGGVNVILSPELTISFSQLGLMSSDGRCKTFDENADGYVRSEGCGVVVLKRLADALRDGDNIMAVIKGSAINQDGRSNGLTAPSGTAQQKVIRQAINRAGASPSEISYVETHGTGTILGDPIEVNSLKDILMQGRSAEQTCWLGSVKTNIGHLEAAAGIAGLIKVVLSLQHHEIPLHLHLKQINSYISIDDSPLEIPVKHQPWLSYGKKRLAGVSSFGFGGTNAHVILEEAPEINIKTEIQSSHIEVKPPLHLLALSARSGEALRQLKGRYVHHFVSHEGTESNFGDICFSANTGRSHFSHRICVVAESLQQAREKLQGGFEEQGIHGISQGMIQGTNVQRVAFLFTGQGSQFAGMGRQLFETQPVFSQAIVQCDDVLRYYLDTPLLDVLYSDTDLNHQASILNQTIYTQTALFALEYALANLWKSWGIIPGVVLGHSVGEYVAGCVAGVFSLEDCLKLIVARGRLMQELPQDGQMIAVFADEMIVNEVIVPYKHEVSIAALNGPDNTVISGRKQIIECVVTELQAKGVRSKPLRVSHAFHSPLMDPILTDFEKVAREITFSPPQIDMISNITGRLATDDIATPEYWVRHIRQPVKFATGMETLHDMDYNLFLEIGPKPVLSDMGREVFEDRKRKTDGNGQGLRFETQDLFELWLTSLRQGRTDWEQMLDSVAQLYTRGVRIDWNGFYHDYQYHRVVLPTYSFQRQHYWPAIEEKQSLRQGKGHPLCGQRIYSAVIKNNEILYESRISSNSPFFLSHHRVFQNSVMPTTGYLEMVYTAATEALPFESVQFRDVVNHRALMLPDDEVKTVQLLLTPEGVSDYLFEVFSLSTHKENSEMDWITHSTGKIITSQNNAVPQQVNLDVIKASITTEVEVSRFYHQLRDRGVEYGERFQAIQQLWLADGEVLGHIQLPESLTFEVNSYKLHPALMDACLQVIGAAIMDDNHLDTYLQVSMEHLQVYQLPGTSLWSYARVKPVLDQDGCLYNADLHIFNAEGELTIKIEGLQLKRTSHQNLLGTLPESLNTLLYEIQWHLQERHRSHLPSDYFPSAGEIANRLNSVALEVVCETELEAYRNVLQKIDTLSVSYIIDAFRKMGWTFQKKQQFSTSSIAHRFGVAGKHLRLLDRLLEILSEEGLVRRKDSLWEVIRSFETSDTQQQIQALLDQYPEARSELVVFRRCATRLSEVLRGECDPLQELLFPEGDATWLAEIFRDSLGVQASNKMVQKAMLSALEHLPSGRVVRILEIGAGTGGTTSHILPYLPADQTEYVFSDISTLFTNKAQQRFREYPFIEYRILDIEQSPELQGFHSHQFDMIVAANIVHATADLRQTLQSIRQLLSPEGILFLLESTARLRWLDLVFGLTDGWWKFKDHDVRPSYPLLSAIQWETLLKEEHFLEVISIDPDEDKGIGLHQTVIVAKGDNRIADDSVQHSVVCGSTNKPSQWIIFEDGQGVGRALSALLEERGHICTFVLPGQAYEKVNEREFRIDPVSLTDMQRLINEVQCKGLLPLCGMIHLWSLESTAQTFTVNDLTEASRLGCASILQLVQTLIRAEYPDVASLLIVTRGAVPTGIENGITGLSQSPLWGMGRVIAVEHPELNSVHVDLDPDSGDDEASSLFEEISQRKRRGEDVIAFRGGKRYVPRLERFKEKIKPQPLEFRSDGACLITGGLGGIGLQVARWVADRGVKHIVLMGRRGIPDYAKAVLHDIEQQGVRVVIAQADVSQADQVARVLTEIKKSGATLRGIMHCAGVYEDRMLLKHEWELFEKVYAPKVLGSWNLHTLTKDMPLDYFVLFSSVATLLSGSGLGNYVAANTFLDVLAHYRRKQAIPALSINWGPWEKIGMAKAVGESREAQWAVKGLKAIKEQQALELLEMLVQENVVQVGVMSVDWSVFCQQISEGEISGYYDAFTQVVRHPSNQQSRFLQQLEMTPVNKRRQLLFAHVRAHVAMVLGLKTDKTMDPHHGFFELGMDSLTSMELRNRIQTMLECSLPATIVFKYPTVESLVTYLFKEVLSNDSVAEDVEETQSGFEMQDKILEEVKNLSEEELKVIIDKEFEAITDVGGTK